MVDELTRELTRLEDLMKGTLNNLHREFSGLRVCRVSTAMLDPITVDAHGARLFLSKIASISLIEPHTLRVQVWDHSLLRQAEAAIRLSQLGLNPQLEETNVISVQVPEPSQDRRREISKVASQYAESAKVAVRSIRREGINKLKKLEKKRSIGIDKNKQLADKIQNLSDMFVKKIDKILTDKQKEIMQS